MKKLPILLILPFLLCGCGNSNKGDETEEISTTRECSINNSDLIKHLDISVTGSGHRIERNSSALGGGCTLGWDYYSTISLNVSLLKKGYVTYSGKCKMNLVLESIYTEEEVKKTKQYTISTDLEFSPSKQSKSLTEEYTKYIEVDSKEKIYSYIPYCSPETVITNWSEPIHITSISFSNSTVVTTYYNYGVSGDPTLTYTTINVNIANYYYYLSLVQEAISGTNYYVGIKPIEPDDLYDYNICVRTNHDTCNLKVDGSYDFSDKYEGVEITDVSGVINVYPGRTI